MADDNLEFYPALLEPAKQVEERETFLSRYFSEANIFSRKTKELEPGTYVNIFFDKSFWKT